MIGAGVLALGAAALVAGCGGTGGSTSSARIRAIDVSPDGGISTIYINSGEANGQQYFEQASTYLYVGSGPSLFTFTLYNNPNLSALSVQYTLNTGSFSSAVVIGSAFYNPELVVLDDDPPTPPSGDAEVRIINAIPPVNSGTSAPINVTFGGTQIAANVQYLAYLASGVGTTSATPSPYNAPYVAVPAGSNTLTAARGSTTLYSQNVSFSAGQAYTVFVTEPTIPTSSTPTAVYGFYQLTDE